MRFRRAHAALDFPVSDRLAAMAPVLDVKLLGAVTVDSGRDGAIAIDAGAGNFAVHADAYGRHAKDTGSPATRTSLRRSDAPFDGRQPNSSHRASGQSFGGSLFDEGFVGVAVTHVDNFYRIPGSNRRRRTPAST